MNIVRELIPNLSLEEFANQHDLTLKIVERRDPGDSRMKFYAQFQRVDVKDGSMLVGIHGNGDSEETAIADYAQKISRKFLVLNAFSSALQGRKEIIAPDLHP